MMGRESNEGKQDASKEASTPPEPVSRQKETPEVCLAGFLVRTFKDLNACRQSDAYHILHAWPAFI
eukprot:scaffold203075_cov28-Prasinocladus_malaysianus.AAC.1